MTPQATEFLEKARRLLAEAEFTLDNGFNEAAGSGLLRVCGRIIET